MPRRWIGDAVIDIDFTGETKEGRWRYAGRVVVPSTIVTLGLDGSAEQKPIIWSFDDLQSGVGGIVGEPMTVAGRPGFLYLDPRSEEVYDRMAQDAAMFGAALSSSDDGTPGEMERAAAIEEATGCELNDDGSYAVRRQAERA
jgi:hypothetical protein